MTLKEKIDRLKAWECMNLQTVSPDKRKSELMGSIKELEQRLAVISGALSSLADIDWHGKWRIQQAIRVADLEQPFPGEGT